MSIDGNYGLNIRFHRLPHTGLQPAEPRIEEDGLVAGTGAPGNDSEKVELPDCLQKLQELYQNGRATKADIEAVIKELNLEFITIDKGDKVTYSFKYTDNTGVVHNYFMTVAKTKDDLIQEMGLTLSDKQELEGLYYAEEGGQTVWYQYDETTNTFNPYTLTKEQMQAVMGLTETKAEGIYMCDDADGWTVYYTYDEASGTFVIHEPTQEELNTIQGLSTPPENPGDKLDTDVRAAYDALSDPAIQQELYDYVLLVMNNDGYDLDGVGVDLDGSGEVDTSIEADDDTYAYSLLSGREIDTFVDAMTTKVIQEESQKNPPNYETAYLVQKIKDEIAKALITDPMAPQDIDHYLMDTEDYLLSPEERAIKHDMDKIGYDTDPEEIDALEVDYTGLADMSVYDILQNGNIFDELFYNDIDSAVDCIVFRDGKPVYDENSFAGIIYQQLDKLEGQLLTLIKSEVEAKGGTYNEENARRYLQFFMTETAREVIQAFFANQGIEAYQDLYPETILAANPSMKDIAELLTTRVKNELAKDNPFDTKMESGTVDSLLVCTSDYFLTPEQREQKSLMVVARYDETFNPDDYTGENGEHAGVRPTGSEDSIVSAFSSAQEGSNPGNVHSKIDEMFNDTGFQGTLQQYYEDLLKANGLEASDLYIDGIRGNVHTSFGDKKNSASEQDIVNASLAEINKLVADLKATGGPGAADGEDETKDFQDVSNSMYTNGIDKSKEDHGNSTASHKYIDEFFQKQSVQDELKEYYECLLEANGIKDDGEKLDFNAIVQSVHGEIEQETKFSDLEIFESAMKAIRKAVIDKAEEQGITLTTTEDFSTLGARAGGDDPKDPETPATDSTTQNNAQAALDALNANEKDPLARSCEDEIFVLEARNNSKPLVFDYTIDSKGNKKFTDSAVQNLYDSLFAQIKAIVGDKGFDEATLKKLFDSAWDTVYTHRAPGEEQDISNFLTDVYNNFRGILDKITQDPAYLDIFTNSTFDSRVANGHDPKNVINYRDGVKVYNDEYHTVHVNDDESDARLQNAVKSLIANLKRTYPNIPEADLNKMVQEALHQVLNNLFHENYSQLPSGFDKLIDDKQINTENLMTLVYTYLESNLYNAAIHDKDGSIVSGNPETEQHAGSNGTPTTNPIISEDTAGTIADVLDSKFDEGDIHLYLDRNDMDTHWLEMEVDSNGNIKFADWKTEKAYNDLFDKMLKALRDKGIKSTDLSDADFKKMYQTAWISAYNSFDNNQRYELQDVLEVVVANLNTIVSKSSSSKDSVARSVIEAGSAMSVVEENNEILNYGNTNINLNYGDGNVHLSDDNSDMKYQAEIEKLRQKLKAKFNGVPEDVIDRLLYQAQKDAIYACTEETRDIPRGLQVDGGTRDGDRSRISIGDLMKLIAYKFDKLLLKGVLS